MIHEADLNELSKKRETKEMGKQTGYVGRIGSVIHYQMDGKFYTRGLPRKYKQTKATKAKSSEFGMASTIGMVIRQNLDSVIFDASDRKMHTRLVGLIYSWLQLARHSPASDVTQPSFQEFKFNSVGPGLSARLEFKIKITQPESGQIQISIPSLIPTKAFRVPKRAMAVVCKIASVVIDIEGKKEIGNAKDEISYDLNDKKVEAKNIIQILPKKAGTLLLTGLYLEYVTMRGIYRVPVNDKRFQPSQFIYAVHN
jgi:hypothetical protein